MDGSFNFSILILNFNLGCAPTKTKSIFLQLLKNNCNWNNNGAVTRDVHLPLLE